jgi:hypothetical protein
MLLVHPYAESSALKPVKEVWSLSTECDMPWGFSRSSDNLGLILKDNGEMATLESRRNLL